MFINFHHTFSYIFMDLHRFRWFFMDFKGFPCIWRGSGARMFGGLWQPVPPCGGLWRPVAADWIPYKKHFRRTGGLDLKAWCLDAWMLAGLKGFEEVADRWEEGIRRTEDLRTSHTLDALGGRRIYLMWPLGPMPLLENDWVLIMILL